MLLRISLLVTPIYRNCNVQWHVSLAHVVVVEAELWIWSEIWMNWIVVFCVCLWILICFCFCFCFWSSFVAWTVSSLQLLVVVDCSWFGSMFLRQLLFLQVQVPVVVASEAFVDCALPVF